MTEFHPDKICEVISITRKRNPVQYPYVLNGHQLKHVDVVKYLGVQRYPMICAGINISTTSRPRLTPLLASYAVTSTAAIHRSQSTAIKPS